MECLSDKLQHDRRMALSYMQEAQITAGLLASHGLNMKQNIDSVNKQSSSPPLNNNTTSSSAAVQLFSSMGAAAAAAASLSMLTPQQLAAASQMSHVIMAASLNPMNQPGASLYRHHQSLFSGWMPSSASPPLHSPGPVSPALSSKSSQASRRTPNHISAANNNNNNIVSSSADRMNKKSGQNGVKKPRAANVKSMKQDGSASLETSVVSPPTSLSPDAPSVISKDGRDKVFTCGVCSRSFGYKHVLQNHERTHTGEKPFKCPECNKRFTRDHHLKTHMRLHTGEKPYHCSHCDRQFVQVANLRRHLRVHTGERPYACELCSAKFSDSNQLKAHLLIHKNEKPFKCEHCHMRFRRRHHLLHHKCAVNPASHVTAAGAGATAALPGSLVTAHLGSSSRSSHTCSDDLEDEIDIDVEMDEDSLLHARHKQSASLRRNVPAMRQLTSPAATVPMNLSGIPVDLPEQTEPEDLSMSSSRSRDFRPQSHSHSHSSGGSPMSHSPSSDIAHEDDEEVDDVENLDVARASPSSLFAPDARRVR